MERSGQSRGLVVALLVVLLVVMVVGVQRGGWFGREGFEGGTAAANGGSVHARYGPDPHNPYTVINKQISAVRGHPHTAKNQIPFWRQPHGLDAYHRSGAHLRPEDYSKAERQMWYAAPAVDCTEPYNPETAHCAEADVTRYHNTHDHTMDYDSYVTDLVTDPRTKENHRRWTEEMRPWGGGLHNVDTMDEALEASVHFTGLRRPQAIAQHNPLQLTENDADTYSGNAKFNFKA